MINHHPSLNTLSEYTAGSLGVAQSLLVAAHCHFCGTCRKQIQSFEELGGAILEKTERMEVSPDLLASLMSKIDQQPVQKETPPKASVSPALADLPPVLSSLIKDKSTLNWRKLTSCLKVAPLTTGQKDYEVALHKISAGGKVFEHDHRGLEYTLVLKGSFSDEKGVYHPGDFILKKPGEVHRPYAAANTDCLCLSAVEAPVRLTGFLNRFLNPFLRIQPS